MMKVRKMTNQDLSVFAHQMSFILQAGISSYEGMMILKDDCQDKVSEKLFEDIISSLEQGESFYQSLTNTQVFPDYMLDMVMIGERSGRLEEVMNSLSQHYQRQHELNNQIKSALSYPLIMILMMFVVIVVLITQVLPIFGQVFIQLGTDLTGFAKVIMSIGLYISNYYYIFLAIIIMILSLFIYLNKRKKEKLRHFIAHFIFTKQLSLNISIGHFMSGMGIALSSGLDINESVDMAKKLVNHPELLKRIDKCQELLNQHEDLSVAMTQSNILNGMNARLLQIGFKTGSIDKIILEIAQRYDEETSQKLNSMISIIEPTLVAVLSVIVGIILLSVMLPLVGIMSSIG